MLMPEQLPFTAKDEIDNAWVNLLAVRERLWGLGIPPYTIKAQNWLESFEQMLSNTPEDNKKIQLLKDMAKHFASLSDDDLESKLGGELLPEFLESLSDWELVHLFWSVRNKTPWE